MLLLLRDQWDLQDEFCFSFGAKLNSQTRLLWGAGSGLGDVFFPFLGHVFPLNPCWCLWGCGDPTGPWGCRCPWEEKG